MSLNFSFSSAADDNEGDNDNNRPLTGRSDDENEFDEEEEKSTHRTKTNNNNDNSNNYNPQASNQATHRSSDSAQPADTAASADSVPADKELDALFAKCRDLHSSISVRRAANFESLENLKSAMKKIRRETDELLKTQQNNLSIAGRKR